MMCSFASSEISGMAMTWFTVCVAIVLRRLRLSTAPAPFGSTYIVLAPIVPPAVVTFQTPKPHVHRTAGGGAVRVGADVERPVARGDDRVVRRRCAVQVDDPAATVRGCERRGALCCPQTWSEVGTGGTQVAVPVVIVTRGRVHRAGRCLQRVVGDRRLRRRGGVAEVLGRRVVDGRVDRIGEGKLRVVEVEREEPLAAGAVELPARLGRRDVPAACRRGSRPEQCEGRRCRRRP